MKRDELRVCPALLEYETLVIHAPIAAHLSAIRQEHALAAAPPPVPVAEVRRVVRRTSKHLELRLVVVVYAELSRGRRRRSRTLGEALVRGLVGREVRELHVYK